MRNQKPIPNKPPRLKVKVGDYYRNKQTKQLYIVRVAYREKFEPHIWKFVLEERTSKLPPHTLNSLACDAIQGGGSDSNFVIWELLHTHQDIGHHPKARNMYRFGDSCHVTNQRLLNEFIHDTFQTGIMKRDCPLKGLVKGQKVFINPPPLEVAEGTDMVYVAPADLSWTDGQFMLVNSTDVETDYEAIDSSPNDELLKAIHTEIDTYPQTDLIDLAYYLEIDEKIINAAIEEINPGDQS